MTPMWLYHPGQEGTEKPALKFKQYINFLRASHLSVAIFRFPDAAYERLETYFQG